MDMKRHRQRHQLERRRRGEQRRASQTQAAQERATMQKQVDRQLRARTWRRTAGWALVSLAIIIGAGHLLAHLGWRPLPLTMGWQDLLVGYPTAALLGIAGLIYLSQRRAPR